MATFKDPRNEPIAVDIGSARVRVETLIMATPTGPKRNLLTEINLHLMQAEMLLKKRDNHTDEP